MSGGRRRLVAAVLAATPLLPVACGDDGSPRDRSGTRAAAPVAVVRDGAYDWQAVPVGGGGFVTGLVALPSAGDQDARVYARTDVGGAYRWDEGTRAWTQLLRSGEGSVTFEAGDYSVASIAAAPGDPDVVVLAAGADFDPADGEALARTGRVLVSRDGGATWTASSQRWFVNGNQPFRTATERLAIDPSDPDRWWFGTQREGLWATTDGGVTWEPVPEEAVPAGLGSEPADPQAGVSLVAALGSTVVAGVANVGVYRSDDAGVTWRQVVALGEGDVPLSATPAGDDLLFTVGITGSGAGRPRIVRLPADGGPVTDLAVPSESWTWNVAVDPFDPEHLVASDEAVRDGHLWTSDDGGERWRSHDVALDTAAIGWLGTTDLESYMTAGRLVFDPVVRGRVWFAEGMGVWRTDDVDAGTVTWATVARGIEETVVSSILVPEGGLPVVTVADRQGFLVEDLERYPAATLVDERFASGTSVAASAGDPSRLAWVGAESNVADITDAEPRGAVSSDGGRTWEEMDGLERAMFGGEVAVSADDPDVMVWLPTHFQHPSEFEADPVGVYVSGDGGRSWDHIEPDGEVDSFHRFFWWFARRALAADAVDASFYLLSDEERFYRSTDGGRTWDRARHAPPCSEPVGCHVEGQLHAVPGQAGTLWASTGEGGLFRTSDAGATPWERVEGIDAAGPFAFGAPVGSSGEPAAYVHGRATGDEREGLWRSVDGGGSWTLVARAPGGLAAAVNAVAGDPERPGRVYVGFAGAGAVVGDDPTL